MSIRRRNRRTQGFTLVEVFEVVIKLGVLFVIGHVITHFIIKFW